jgi:hypothetical protein
MSKEMAKGGGVKQTLHIARQSTNKSQVNLLVGDLLINLQRN